MHKRLPCLFSSFPLLRIQRSKQIFCSTFNASSQRTTAALNHPLKISFLFLSYSRSKKSQWIILQLGSMAVQCCMVGLISCLQQSLMYFVVVKYGLTCCMHKTRWLMFSKLDAPIMDESTNESSGFYPYVKSILSVFCDWFSWYLICLNIYQYFHVRMLKDKW